jgi:RNA polymerase sigma-70 factor (ECF subfamily)
MTTLKQETQLHITLNQAHMSYEKGLHARAFFKVQNRETSEDLVQDTFLKTWKYLVKGGKVVLMKAFLYHILNDLVVDEYRKNKPLSLDTLYLEKGFEPSHDESEHMFNFLDGKAAMLLIKQLPLAYQKVMRMRYVQDLSLKEMSLITGKSKNVMAVQVHRGLIKLKLLYYAK